MLRQIELLTKLQLMNLFGLNEARHAPDGRRRWKLIGMGCLFALVGLVFCFYVGLACYGIARIGFGELAPLLLALAVSLVILTFTALRAGGVLFDLRSYERLTAMPLRPEAIIVSRFLTMYIFDAALALLVLLPGTIVCGAMLRPGAAFYPLMLLGALVLPLIPMTLAMLLGAAIYALSARMRHKNLAVILLSVALLAALMGGFLFLRGGEVDAAWITNLVGGLYDRLGGIYPPAAWFARSVNTGDVGSYALLAAASLALFALAAGLIGRYFAPICNLLNARASRGGFSMAAQRRRSPLGALYRREIRRYFASPTYVMNSLVGGLMVVIFSVALRIAGARSVAAELLFSVERVRLFAPLLPALMFLISPSTCSAISMEGGQFWQVRSLPVSERQVYGAKIGVSLTLMLPCWALSAPLLLGALRPRGLEAAALALLPLGYILYGSALGLWINLKAPMLNWESERQPVKQSRAVLYMVLAGFISVLVPGAALWFLPRQSAWIHGLTFALTIAATGLIWRRCAAIPLRSIE